MTDGRIAILTKDHGPWQLDRYPLPDPEPGAILVRISYANVCGSDLHHWRGEGVIPEGGRRHIQTSAGPCGDLPP